MTRIRRFAALVICLALVDPTPAKAAGKVVELDPVSNWVLDYADDSCALRRLFGPEDQRVWLELRQFAPEDELLVSVASPTLKALKRRPTTRFEPGGPEREQHLAAFGSYGEDMEGTAFPDTLRPISLGSSESLVPWDEEQRDERERSINGLRVKASFDRDLFLKTGELNKPMTAMRACLDDLVKTWGIEPALARSPTGKARPRNMGRWATPIQQLFPTGLVYLGKTARVTFRLILTAEGKPEACRVMRPVVDKKYEKTICDILLDKAEYEPARDASGDAVRGYHLLNVIYVTS